MLSLHTNSAALSAQNSISRTQSQLSTSQTRLSTGFRVNSAMDDAAGLQIATRLKYQTSGMTVAMRNTQNSISMMQTAEGALDETTNILVRMKDLATQSADGSSTDSDRTAMQAEYDALGKELTNIVANTSFGGTSLLGTKTGSKFGSGTAVTFQIGTSSSETMSVDLTTELTAMNTSGLTGASAHFGADGVDPAGATTAGTEIASATTANASIDKLATAIDNVSTVRSALGAVSNRLDHVYNNLANVSTNTKAATGRIMDTDFAAESSNMTSAQMLLQAGTAMLKQSNSTSSLVMSLLQ
ncbi:Lateral flagellin [Duganella sp. CY15W]|uniref:flagellin N-terminal helical domain-containing protein n=1 Tax=Duganella sp. CY15W TaxID=2692172 RepID=UPI00136AA132|nr:flagellin [Duganella sp. CY15W]MYM27795.1 Lateral flagellin [Duganella sp. CY15W]